MRLRFPSTFIAPGMMRRRCFSRFFVLYSILILPTFYMVFRYVGDGSYWDDHTQATTSIPVGHPLENTCKYPILNPEDPNLLPYIQHGQRLECFPSQENYVSLDDNFVLTVDQAMAEEKLGRALDCYYRPIAGGIQPGIRDIVPLRPWTKIDANHSSDFEVGLTDLSGRYQSVRVYDDIVEVRCYLANQSNVESLLKMAPTTSSDSEIVFRYAFAQIGQPVPAVPVEDPTGTRDPRHKYGIDILVLDSTSLNMFRRHAPSSWRYMKKTMGFFHLDGYMKVADNSLVNLIPLLTGLQYEDSGDGVPSDFVTNQPLNSDEIPLLWRLFKEANCATMFGDDIAHPTRGFFNYPLRLTPGFKTKPTDHFFRPWHLYHRWYPIFNSSRFCFGSRPYFEDFIRLTEQMVRRYRDKCHFSFNFLTDLTHDDSNKLELLDEYLKGTLMRLYERRDLENTILIIMGDHGNRVNLIRYKYIGRIEERMPLFAVYLPPSFQRQYPERVKNLRLNQHRLTTHFDSFQMFHDILHGRYNSNGEKSEVKDRWSAKRKGLSLFGPIPANRTCRQAHVPENHCTCMLEPRMVTDDEPDPILPQWATETITEWTNRRCEGSVPYSVKMLGLAILTTNQMVQHGVRHMVNDNATMTQVQTRMIEGEIEYLDVIYEIRSKSRDDEPIVAEIRLQRNTKLKTLIVNVEPRVLRGSTKCAKGAKGADNEKGDCVCMFGCVIYCM